MVFILAVPSALRISKVSCWPRRPSQLPRRWTAASMGGSPFEEMEATEWK